jgi:hypothetical protein
MKARHNGHLVAVFEAVNESRKEIYLGTTSRLIASLIKEFRTAPPERVAHWKRRHRVRFYFIEYAISRRAAAALVKRNAPRRADESWKVFRED